MKKTLAVLLSLVMALGLFVGCGDGTGGGDGSTHTHTFAETWTYDEDNHWHAATCEHTSEVSGRAAHTFGNWVTITEQTCTQDGKQERTCTVCGYKEEQTLPMFVEHDYQVAQEITATCVRDGQILYECSHCGDRYTKNLGKDPTNHVGEVYACGSHCEECAADGTTASDHVVSSCGIEGHYSCDGLDHLQCVIPVDENMHFTSTEDGNGWILSGFKAAVDSDEIIVPAYVEGKPVVEIANGVFDATSDDVDSTINDWLKTITYLYIPDTVTTIGNWFAWQMSALEELRLPKAVEFAEGAVFDCTSLTEFSIPRGTVDFGGSNAGFSSSEVGTPAIETLVIPVSFTDMMSIKSFFTVVEGLAVKYEGTQEQWNALVAAVEGDNTITAEEYRAILQAATVSFGYNYETQYTAESAELQEHLSAFQFDPGTGMITGYTGGLFDTLTIPAAILGVDVTGIGNGAFDAAKWPSLANVKTIDFSEATNLTTIGNENFNDMPALESVSLPATVTSVGYQCFFRCPNLTTVTIPEDATMDVSRAPFAFCDSLTSVTLPATLEGESDVGAFALTPSEEGEGETADPADTARGLTVTFPGLRYELGIHMYKAAANFADIEVVYGGTDEIIRDGNGVEYVLNEDGASYTLVGFYDVPMAGDPLAPVTGYTVPQTFDPDGAEGPAEALPVTGIGDGVFNSKAYVNTEVITWLNTTLTGILLAGGTSGTNVDSIGNYNYVSLAATEIELPVSITNETLVGCFNDITGTVLGYSAFTTLRIPKGVRVLRDCLNWTSSDTVQWFNGQMNPFILLPASLEKFEGECWSYGLQATAAVNTGLFTVMEGADAAARTKFQAILDASEVTTETWSLTLNLFGQFIGAQFVYGEGGALAASFIPSYDAAAELY